MLPLEHLRGTRWVRCGQYQREPRGGVKVQAAACHVQQKAMWGPLKNHRKNGPPGEAARTTPHLRGDAAGLWARVWPLFATAVRCIA